MYLSDKIRIIRKARGFSQEKLGECLNNENQNGISRQSISDWESGKSEPKLDNIRELAKVLNVSFDALLDDSLDLNDQQVLNSVLKHLEPRMISKVNSKFRYSIYLYSIKKKDYIKAYISGSIIGLAIIASLIFIVLSICNIVTWLSTIIILAVTLPTSTAISIPINQIKNIRKGGYGISIGELNNSHLIINSYNNASNTIYIPTEKIEKMELGTDANMKHGPVLIYVSGRARPITLYDIKEPNKLVEVFNNLQNYIQDDDEIKIM